MVFCYLCSPESVYSQTHTDATMITPSSGLETVLVAGEAAFPCHSHTLQQRTGVYL